MNANNTNMDQVAADLAQQWFRDQSANVYLDLYVWARRAEGDEGIALPIVAEDAPDARYFLVSSRLPVGHDVPTQTRNIRDYLRHAPIFNPNLKADGTLGKQYRHDTANLRDWLVV